MADEAKDCRGESITATSLNQYNSHHILNTYPYTYREVQITLSTLIQEASPTRRDLLQKATTGQKAE